MNEKGNKEWKIDWSSSLWKFSSSFATILFLFQMYIQSRKGMNVDMYPMGMEERKQIVITRKFNEKSIFAVLNKNWKCTFKEEIGTFWREERGGGLLVCIWKGINFKFGSDFCNNSSENFKTVRIFTQNFFTKLNPPSNFPSSFLPFQQKKLSSLT